MTLGLKESGDGVFSLAFNLLSEISLVPIVGKVCFSGTSGIARTSLMEPERGEEDIMVFF